MTGLRAKRPWYAPVVLPLVVVGLGEYPDRSVISAEATRERHREKETAQCQEPLSGRSKERRQADSTCPVELMKARVHDNTGKLGM